MKKLCVFLLPLLAVTCIAGCSIKTTNNGEVGFSYATNLSFFHRAQQTSPEPAVISSEFPSLEEWIKKDDPPVTVIDATVVPPSN